MSKRREFGMDLFWGVLVAALVLAGLLLGTSGAKFIYIDF